MKTRKQSDQQEFFRFPIIKFYFELISKHCCTKTWICIYYEKDYVETSASRIYYFNFFFFFFGNHYSKLVYNILWNLNSFSNYSNRKLHYSHFWSRNVSKPWTTKHKIHLPTIHLSKTRSSSKVRVFFIFFLLLKLK